MRKIILFIAFLVACISMNASPVKPKGTVILPTDLNIRYTGRININDPFRPMFVYPGVQIEARFTGTSLRMMAKPESGYFMVGYSVASRRASCEDHIHHRRISVEG